MWRIGLIALSLASAGCASQPGVGKQINAVVQDEQARQAAVDASAKGADSKEALKAGAAAADPQVATPPS